MDLSPSVALLGLLLEQADGENVRGIAEKASIGLLVIGFPCAVALIARSFAATTVDEKRATVWWAYRLNACGAAEGVVVGVENALERMRRRRCR